MGARIIVVNQSSLLTSAEVIAAIDAINTQIARDFSPHWGLFGTLVPARHGYVPNPGEWMCYLLDDSDQADALGYHQTTAHGDPLGKVFIRSVTQAGLSWTVDFSHEILEMLGDPEAVKCVYCNATVTTGTIFAWEVCDAVQSDDYAYLINGVKVTNFVTPAWFEATRAADPAVRYDFRKVLSGPLQLAPGGYIGAYQVPNDGEGWTQITAETAPPARLLARQGYGRTGHRGPFVLPNPIPTKLKLAA